MQTPKVKTHDNMFGHHIFIDDGYSSITVSAMEEVEKEKLIKELRPAGKWIYEDGAMPCYRCSHCNKFMESPTGHNERFEDLTRTNAYPICPRCGADMTK